METPLIVTISVRDIETLKRVLHEHDVVSAPNVKRCEHCPEEFAYGAGTGRRSSARYCSDRCRVAAHRNRAERMAALITPEAPEPRHIQRPEPESNGAPQLVWGAKAIGDVIGRNERQTFYLLEKGMLPARKVGEHKRAIWVAERGRLITALVPS